MDSLTVSYILLHFPYLTETFVAEEIEAIQSLGVDVRIISLLGPGPGPIQPLSQRLLRHVWYVPSLFSFELWRAQFHYFFKSPRNYLDLLVQLLRQPYPSQPFVLLAKRLVIFLKAVSSANHLKRCDVMLLHAHFAWLPGAAAWICSSLLELPFTVTVHAYDIYASNDLISLICNQANHIVSISEYNRQHLESVVESNPNKISVNHCGVNLSQIQPKPPAEVRRPINSPIKIISVGSLVPKKGHSYLIDACHLLKQQDVDFTCTIIGSGPQEDALNQQIQRIGLQGKIKLVGPRTHPEVVAAYYQHDVFVLASVITPKGNRDGIPVVLMEAGAVGLPLISTKVSGIPELISHGETGWLIPPRDSAALADAIDYLASEPALRVKLGRKAQNFVETEFSITSTAPRLISLFQSVYKQWHEHQSQSTITYET